MEQTKTLTDRQLNKMGDGREYRAMTMSVRASDDDDGRMIVEGYATTFNQPYMLGEEKHFRVMEQVDASAFTACDMSDVIMQYDHAGRVFARNKNGTLLVSTDTIGLKVTADLGGTDIGRQLYQEIRGGYTDKMSFGFTVDEDTRTYTYDEATDTETCMRTILRIKKLYDVSAVSLPANDMTSISARRYANGVIGAIKAERLTRANKIKKLKLLLEV